jgi:hypothetical protein
MKIHRVQWPALGQRRRRSEGRHDLREDFQGNSEIVPAVLVAGCFHRQMLLLIEAFNNRLKQTCVARIAAVLPVW